jgi:hypothetical protein
MTATLLTVPASGQPSKSPPASSSPTRSTSQDTAKAKPKTPAKPRATSQERYKVQKQTGEAAGVLEMTRADSIAAVERARRDSIARDIERQRDEMNRIERRRADSLAALEREERARRDSIAAAEAAWRDSVARADAEAEARRQYLARFRFGGNGWYVGFGAGASAPTTTFNNLGYSGGYNLNVPIGWHRERSGFGARLDLTYHEFNGDRFRSSSVDLTNNNPQVFSGTLNVTGTLPYEPMENVKLYGLAGAGAYHFRSFGTSSALGGFLGNDLINGGGETKNNRTKFGMQGGVGIDWTVGTSALYLESRFVSVFTERKETSAYQEVFGTGRSEYLQWVPIVLGVKLR